MPDDKPVNLVPFKRANMRLARIGATRLCSDFQVHALAQLGYGLDPRAVPVDGLQVMGATCPSVYLAEQTISGIIRRPDLFSIRHEDPKVVAEAEAWLWPLLPRLLAAAARGFSYGTVACVLDWERRTIRFQVPSKTKDGATRSKTAVDHTHYRQAFEVHPDATMLLLDDQGELAGVDVYGSTYGVDRAAVWSWDPEFGEARGQGARQRAWTPYCRFLIVSLLRDKYLERSVDSPRVAFAPEGKVKIEDVDKDIPEHVVDLLLDLQGSGAVGLPSVRDASGNRKYEVESLDLPDRSTVWAEAIDRCDGEVFKAYLVPPAMAGTLEEGGGAGARALDGMLREFIENLAGFAAAGLTRLLALVHEKNYDPEKVEAPTAVATDVGKAAARKTFMEVLRLANSAARGEISARADLPKLLDAIGIPIREAPFDPFDEADPSGEEPGRPRDPHGEREDRREDATTEDGEDDTGGEDVDREERE